MDRWHMISSIDDWYRRTDVNSRDVWSHMDGWNMSRNVDVRDMRSYMDSRHVRSNMNWWVMWSNVNWRCVRSNVHASWEWMPAVVWCVSFVQFQFSHCRVLSVS